MLKLKDMIVYDMFVWILKLDLFTNEDIGWINDCRGSVEVGFEANRAEWSNSAGSTTSCAAAAATGEEDNA
jgi:hypothetical protein